MKFLVETGKVKLCYAQNGKIRERKEEQEED